MGMGTITRIRLHDTHTFSTGIDSFLTERVARSIPSCLRRCPIPLVIYDMLAIEFLRH